MYLRNQNDREFLIQPLFVQHHISIIPDSRRLTVVSLGRGLMELLVPETRLPDQDSRTRKSDTNKESLQYP